MRWSATASTKPGTSARSAPQSERSAQTRRDEIARSTRRTRESTSTARPRARARPPCRPGTGRPAVARSAWTSPRMNARYAAKPNASDAGVRPVRVANATIDGTTRTRIFVVPCKRDVDQRVTNVRIGEALEHLAARTPRRPARRACGTISSNIARRRKRADALVAHGVAHRLQPGEQRHRHDDRVRAVQQADLSLAIRPNVRRDDDARILAGETESRAQRVVALDREERVRLAGREHLVAIAEHSLEALASRRVGGAPGTMRSTSVLQNTTAVVEPALESRVQVASAARARATMSRENRRRCPRSSSHGSTTSPRAAS